MRARRVDIRQVMAAILTLSMFIMLMNMIKRDHFDYVESEKVHVVSFIGHMISPSLIVAAQADFRVINRGAGEDYPGGPTVTYQTLQIRGTSSVVRRPDASRGRLMEEKKTQLVEHCWKISAPKVTARPQPKGYIIFTLTNGPEYHMLQVANAVVVAKYLGATLVLPDIRGKKPEERRNFSDIYDDQKFINSLKGVVAVARNQPIKDSRRKSPAVRLPSMVSEGYIEAHVKPLFHQYGSLRISIYFPSINTWKTGATEHLDPTKCLALFGVLQLQPRVRGIVDGMIKRIVKSGKGPKAKIVAVDLRDGILHSRSCLREGKIKFCDVKEVGEFLRKAGFGPETAIYIARSRWQENLDPLRDFFPRTFTKELLNPRDDKQKLIRKRDSELGKVIDFAMCLESDVYVPITKDLFSTNAAAARIASGRTQILIPAEI